ncbi:MAG: hypothetical protein ACT4TC_24750, partial [Myxococcaceae bacterium]
MRRPMTRQRLLALSTALLFSAACGRLATEEEVLTEGPPANSEVDAGTEADAGTTGTPDAGNPIVVGPAIR